ncbi:signal peptide peptidase SppA [Pseudothauera nasutitermitis]|uniref:Signal peptide peptidase SppA n=1 Tax=Pseudothauera nasutitermitis TaxID=2565930 RepID=A0A4S4AXT1_9RHOO|nr:signal peptide peptidase SppA [Pseudothauera nasutitermitis]THF64912.1 signal peptide peptidase SppA [Pseudothauera nasutitermitis]
MIGRFFGFIGRVLRGIWRWLDAVRRTAFNLVFLFLLGVVVAVLFRPGPQVPDGAALVLRPSGILVEQAAFEDPLSLLRSDRTPSGQVPLADLLEAVRSARDDARIGMLVLETDRLQGGGLSKLAELRDALADFRAAGKPVLVRGERFSQAQYYLGSVADEIHMAPDGFLLLRGLARYITYFGDALERLGVKVHVFRVGEYKSFSEPFTRRDMSEEDRESSRDLLEGLWDAFRTDVATARKIEPEAFDRYVNDYAGALSAAGGDAARAALDAGLVDRLSTRDEWRRMLIGRLGSGAAQADAEDGADEELIVGESFRQVGLGGYLSVVRGERARAADQIAVLVAQGAIMDGEQPPGAVGGDTLARLIREVREDDQVKAVVLRIDSPGGSAWASELIRRELELTREAGKPVVASMSSVAASGGYWIAAGADEIWASPVSLTGSIGIFALFPEFARPLDQLGIGVDGVATGPLAGAFDPRRPMEPAAAQALQIGIEHGYQRFLQTVAKARGLELAEVDDVARGRVWTGRAAADLGLVDQLGGLEAAIVSAAKRAGIEDYELVWPAPRLSPTQRLLRSLFDVTGLSGGAVPATPSAFGALLGGLEDAAADLLRWNDPAHLYVHCLCESP